MDASAQYREDDGCGGEQDEAADLAAALSALLHLGGLPLVANRLAA